MAYLLLTLLILSPILQVFAFGAFFTRLPEWFNWGSDGHTLAIEIMNWSFIFFDSLISILFILSLRKQKLKLLQVVLYSILSLILVLWSKVDLNLIGVLNVMIIVFLYHKSKKSI